MLKFGHGFWLHMKLFRINSIGGALRAMVAWPFLVAGIYMMAAIIGSTWQRPGAFISSSNSNAIYLHDNGIHVSIIIERKQHLLDLDQGFPASDLPGNQPPAKFLMFGWGDQDFYLNTPTWGDLSPRHALNAFAGSGKALVHIDHLDALPTGSKQINVEIEDLNTIITAIDETIDRPDGQTNPHPIKGYGSKDIFYPAKKYNYSALYTCNNWVSDILAKGHVRTGRWTPLPFGVMWWH
jgi:uncharacterized protein (TIGR02117 family)